jgi:serine/threonine-protein phosphatase 2A regulatory subunit B'
MIRANLFRALPPIPPLAKSPLLGDDIKDSYTDAAWLHVQYVYQIFQLRLESPQMQPSQHLKRFDHSFLVSFFGLFNSMDFRERDSMKQALHALYLKFNQLRPMLRQIMQEIFLTFIYETKYYNGINELLDFYESIVSGFTVPIKPENIRFLFDILIPLHASDVLHVYYENLTACVGDFLEKDPNLVPAVLTKLIRYWPVSSTIKARLFMAEIGQLIDIMSEEQFKQVAVDLMVFLCNAIESVNFALAEAAICLWKSDAFVGLVVQNAATAYPILVPALYRSGVGHWNPAIKNVAVSVLRICLQTSPEIYDQVIKGLQEIEALTASRLKTEQGAWLEVARQAEGFDHGIRIVNRPFAIDRVFAT